MLITLNRCDVGPTTDRKFVGLKVVGGDGEEVRLNIPPESIEPMVVGLLGSAAALAEMNKSKAQSFEEMKELSLYAMARGVAAQDVSDRKNAFALSFLFGQTRLAIGLSKDVLQQLGSALLAASADSSKPPQ